MNYLSMSQFELCDLSFENKHWAIDAMNEAGDERYEHLIEMLQDNIDEIVYNG